MFGTARDPAGPDPAEAQASKPVFALGQQAQAFFAGRGKVASTNTPRPTRPGTPVRQRPPAARVVSNSAAPSGIFGSTGPGVATADARAAEMAAEADFIDDIFDEGFDSDAPGC